MTPVFSEFVFGDFSNILKSQSVCIVFLDFEKISFDKSRTNEPCLGRSQETGLFELVLHLDCSPDHHISRHVFYLLKIEVDFLVPLCCYFGALKILIFIYDPFVGLGHPQLINIATQYHAFKTVGINQTNPKTQSYPEFGSFQIHGWFSRQVSAIS